MSYNNIKFEKSEGIGVITIDRPKALNALNSETLAELGDCLNKIEKDDEVKVIILTGGGDKAFVAGADISEMINGSGVDGRAFGLLAREAFNKLERMDKPSIAAVNGFALGGGCEISMACDITVASENAKFGQPEVGLGITPGFGGTQRLPRLVGKKRAKELIFTADTIDAEEAYRIGLVNHVVPQAELMDYCKKMAKKIASNAPVAVALSKQAINMGLDMDIDNGVLLEANLFGLSMSTEDKKEGMGAFLEKRKEKNFTGK